LIPTPRYKPHSPPYGELRGFIFLTQEECIMLKGFAITPPVVGRISIGRMVERNGKRLPEKDDQFTITTQVQNREGWILHPVDAELRGQTDSGKLRNIPITLRSEEHTSELQSRFDLVCRLLLEKKKKRHSQRAP